LRRVEDKERKHFFFEKKKQKTFALARAPPGVDSPQLARMPTSKSFLVLFFKKEHFLFLL
jgi:hypothetical protein